MQRYYLQLILYSRYDKDVEGIENGARRDKREHGCLAGQIL